MFHALLTPHLPTFVMRSTEVQSLGDYVVRLNGAQILEHLLQVLMRAANKSNIIGRCFFRLMIVPFIAWIFFDPQLGLGDPLRVGVAQLPQAKGNPFFRPYGGGPDPLTLTAFFQALTQLDENGVLRPQLAKAWTQVSPTTWRFELREDVFFSNGSRFDSNSVVGNFEIVSEPENAAFDIVRLLGHVIDVSSVSPTEIEITTSRPAPFLPNTLSVFFMVNPELWRALGKTNFSNAPVGTGAFDAIEWGTRTVRGRAAPNAWKNSAFETLKVMQLPMVTSRVQGLLAGQLDIAFALDPESAAYILSEGHKVYSRLEPGVVILAFNLAEESPIQDVRVRRALNHAIDKARILEAVLDRNDLAPSQFASRMAFGFNPELDAYPYNPELARQLLSEAGYPDGFSFAAEVVQGMSGYSAAIYQVAAQYLSEFSVDLEIRAVPVSRYSEILFQGNWNGLATNLDYASDPSMDPLIPIHRHSCNGTINSYCDKELMPLLNSALNTADLQVRRSLTRRVIERTTEQAPGIMLWEKVRFDGYSKRISNFRYDIGSVPYDELVFE